MRRVLVTRPEPGASETAGRLSARAFEPVLLPLTKVEPLPLEAWPRPENFRLVTISSANAVRHAPPALLQEYAALPAFAVGERTGAVARAAGLKVVDSGAGDAANLVRRVAAAASSGARVLMLCGRVRRDILERGLTDAGLEPVALEIYETVSLQPSEDEILAALGRQPVDAVLLYSAASAAALFAALADAPAATGLLDQAIYVAISERVADMVPDTERARVQVAAEPTDEAMLTLLSAMK